MKRAVVDWRGVAASQIDDGLWQGGFAPVRDLLNNGLDVLVLSAIEAQPSEGDVRHIRELKTGTSLILCGILDTEDPVAVPRILKIATGVGKRVGELLRDGKTVYVSCAVGLNRSGLISALALCELHGWDGARAVAHVRNKRAAELPAGEVAFSNNAFRKYVEGIAAK